MKRWIFATLFLVTAAGCTTSGEDTTAPDQHDHDAQMLWVETTDPLETSSLFERDEAFEQISFWLEGPTPVITARVRTDGAWGRWVPVEITWSDADRHVGRLFADGDAVEFRGLAGMDEVGVEFLSERRGRDDLLTRDLPFARPEPSLTGAVAPRSLVIPRSEWGSRDPNKLCGSVIAPYRISIHHTALPDSDGGDPAARMRQMQAYHIDTNGWCDIGYHFVVSQSGNIYQGRADERRPGAHVGAQNAGNVGISLIGDYTSVEPPQVQIDSTTEIVNWVAQTYDIALDRSVIKGHREWPGQSTGCPGNRLLALIDTIIGSANEPTVTDIDVWTESDGLDDPLVQGASLEKPDAFPADTFEVSIYVRNNSSGPIRDVELGYFVEEPYLRATNYIIETNAPGFGNDFMVNDADAAETNPGRDALGTEGALTMFAFAAGETKRVRITLEAVAPSIGKVDRPDVRGWLRNVDGVYAQDGFRDEPSLNNADEVLSAYSEFDILSRDGWLFDSDEAEMLEGWVACQEGVTSASIDPERSGIVVATEGDDPCIVSPAWTVVDADSYDQLVVELDSDSAPHRAALFWSTTDAETFNADRAVGFDIPEGGGRLVVNLGDHPLWEGTVERLRLDPIEGEAIDGEVVVGALLFQSSDGRTTTVPGFDFSPQPAIDGDVDTDEPGGGTEDLDDENRLVTNSGCAQAGGGNAASLGFALLLLVGAVRLRRRLI